MPDYDYDLFVIGGGSGGVRAARMAAGHHRARVGLAEESRYGGTCVIRGCVPKKLMVFASGYPAEIEDARAYGWDVEPGDFNWDAFHGKLTDELDRLEGVYRRLLKTAGVETFDQRATLKDKHTVVLADGTEKTAKNILIAVGGWPVKPDIPGADLAVTSNEMFRLKELPKKLLINGGGYIACEFACIMAGLGVEVTLYYRGAQILNGFDDEARGLIAEEMRQRGIDIHTGTNVLEMCPESQRPDTAPSGSDATMGVEEADREHLVPEGGEGQGPVWVKASNGHQQVFDLVLFATGRSPNTEGLGLEDLGVELGRKGEIKVDEYNRTAVDSIWALGDVTDRVNLTPVAIHEAMCFVKTVFEGEETAVDHELIPTAIFTQPEYGVIGMTEEQATERGDVEIYCASFRPMQQAFAAREDRAMMKLIVCMKSRKILGCHIVAPHAGEMIQLVGIAIKMGATKEDFDNVMAVHPTMAEELVTMREPIRKA